MEGKNIFIGTIKKCRDLYFYKQYGDEHYFGDYRIGHTEVGTTHKYVDIIDEEAILIKVGESKYIWVDLLANKIEEFLVNLGIHINTIGITPLYDNDLFVDEKTIQPAFKENKKNLSIKKVKSLVKQK